MKNYSNSNISPTARLFENIRCINSIVEDSCCIGDDSDIVASRILRKSELGRRNILRNSSLGVGSYTGTNSIIFNADIGKYCCIGWNVSIGGGNHNYHNVSMYTDYWYKRTFEISSAEFEYGGVNEVENRVSVGNDVWIGAGASILQGCSIGDGCVIGAGAIVINDVEPYSIVVGVPGKVLKRRFQNDTIALLLQLKWWDWPEEIIKKELISYAILPMLRR